MKNTTVRELIDSGKYGELADYFWTFITEDHLNSPLSNYGYEACGFEEALERCEELARCGERQQYPKECEVHFDSSETLEKYEHPGQFTYNIYTRQEVYQCHELQEAKLIFFPRSCETELTKETGKAFALIIPGGGFARQWTLIEGYAIAARLNKLGISAFVLLYRTAQDGVIYKALEDMRRAVTFICENAASFDVSTTSYIMGGFSAGATLAGLMASDNLGYKAANVATQSCADSNLHISNLPKPEMIFLGYPAQRMDLFYNAWKNAPEGSEAKLAQEAFLRRLIKPVGFPSDVKDHESESDSKLHKSASDGKFHITKADIAPLILEDHISRETCPPLFITACEDDPVVPFINSQSLYDKAQSLGIPAAARFGATGGHSFGLGNGLEVDGWLEDAINFWRQNH